MKIFLILLFVGLTTVVYLLNIQKHENEEIKLVLIEDYNISDKEIKKLDGNYLIAFNIAMKDFLEIKDLTDEQKSLKHYTINFSENNESYMVSFEGKLLSEYNMMKYNRLIVGRETKYEIDKKKLIIKKRLFGK